MTIKWELIAVDVLAQKRAFFKIYSDLGVVFFVWMNPDEFPHDNSKGDRDPCYKEFKSLLSKGEIEEYRPEVAKSPDYIAYGKFRKNLKFHVIVKDENSHAQANLNVFQKSKNDYEIEDIHESDFFSDSLPLLLEFVADEAAKEHINLYVTVENVRDDDFKSSISSALLKTGFEQIDQDELAVYYSKKFLS